MALARIDLPQLSVKQRESVRLIRKAGGSYCRFEAGRFAGWLPPDGHALSDAAKRHHRLTDRVIRGLIRSGWVEVTGRGPEGEAVKVTLSV